MPLLLLSSQRKSIIIIKFANKIWSIPPIFVNSDDRRLSGTASAVRHTRNISSALPLDGSSYGGATPPATDRLSFNGPPRSPLILQSAHTSTLCRLLNPSRTHHPQLSSQPHNAVKFLLSFSQRRIFFRYIFIWDDCSCVLSGE